jgi:DNA-binding FadR family transcriptional regulator
MDARAAIEPANAYFATARASAINLDELSDTVRQMRGSARGESYSEMRSFWFADETFHRLIAELTDNLFLISAYSTLGGHVQRFRLFAGAGVTDADSAIDEHHVILEAMIAGDKERARLLMADHIGRVNVRVQADRKAFVVREDSLK